MHITKFLVIISNNNKVVTLHRIQYLLHNIFTYFPKDHIDLKNSGYVHTVVNLLALHF